MDAGTINQTAAKQVFEEMYRTGQAPAEVVEALGLTQVSDADELTRIIDGVIAANPKPVADYKSGKVSAAGRLVGEVMKATRGRANPGVVKDSCCASGWTRCQAEAVLLRVICTGISGTERVGFLDEVRTLAAQAGRDLQIFDVRDVMFQVAQDIGEPVEEETILDMFPHALVLLRAAALEKISSLCEQAGQHQDWIINTHAVFRWKNTLISGFDPYYLQRLKPDLYVTITAGVLTVRERLRRHPRWEDTTVSELLVWREEEQWATEEMARIHHKPQYLLGRALPPRALYRLMFEPNVKTAYLSYPMQHADGDRAGAGAFKAAARTSGC